MLLLPISRSIISDEYSKFLECNMFVSSYSKSGLLFSRSSSLVPCPHFSYAKNHLSHGNRRLRP